MNKSNVITSKRKWAQYFGVGKQKSAPRTKKLKRNVRVCETCCNLYPCFRIWEKGEEFCKRYRNLILRENHERYLKGSYSPNPHLQITIEQGNDLFDSKGNDISREEFIKNEAFFDNL